MTDFSATQTKVSNVISSSAGEGIERSLQKYPKDYQVQLPSLLGIDPREKNANVHDALAAVGNEVVKNVNEIAKNRYSRDKNEWASRYPNAFNQQGVPPKTDVTFEYNDAAYGELASERVELMGMLVTRKASPEKIAKFGKSISTNYKKNFFEANPETKGKVVVHHAVEQQVQKRYPNLVSNSEMHSVENLRGIPKEINSEVHLSSIRKEWNKFYRQTPHPTKQQLLDKANDIDNQFGNQFNPKVRE